MRTIYTLSLLLVFSLFATAQDLNILLVDDSDDFSNNTSVIANGLTNNQYDFDLFDAASASSSPNSFFLSNYDLVIWHTSTQQEDMLFWDIETIEPFQTTDNDDLLSYLEQGGNLWLIGNDFLFDRYSDAPDTFQLGDFVYDQLGILQYDAQAYADDDNFGLPIAQIEQGQPIPGLGDINWVFPTLWWADAITPHPEAVTIYKMGFDNYLFAGATTGVWYDNGTSKTLTFLFDLARANNQGLVDNTVRSIIEYFTSVLTSTEELPVEVLDLEVYPNPVQDQSTVSLSLATSSQVQLSLVDVHGRQVEILLPDTSLSAGLHQINWQPTAAMPNGMYFLQVTVNGQIGSKAIILER